MKSRSFRQNGHSSAALLMLLFGLALLLTAVLWMAWLVAQAPRAGVAAEPAVPAMATGAPMDSVADSVELVDEAFGVRGQGLALRRVVQMLQWREVASVPLAPSDEIVVDLGDYQLVWAARAIDSSRYALAQDHANPGALPYRSRSFGQMPELAVDSEQSYSAGWVHVPPSGVTLPDNLQAVFRAEGEWFVSAPEGAAPEAGDLRVRFDLMPAKAAGLSAGEAAAPDINPANADPTGVALVWIARVSAFVLALVGAGLALRGAAQRAPVGSRLARLSSAGLLAIAAWGAVAALLLAVVLARLFG